ncbi:MAG TPA: hypothetical protein DEF45_10350 [Rhodopirellula sp.]|nr:hypothetical protein [Rhodopirellula sp.]
MLPIILLLAIFSPLQKEPTLKKISPKAESVISRFIRAKGGESALKKIRDYAITGEVVAGERVVGTFEIFQAANRHLTIDHFPDGSSRRHGTDGKIAWNIGVDGKATILDGQESRDYMRHYETMHESLEWQQQFTAILYSGEKTISNENVNHLIFVANDNRQINRYFSTKTGLLVREEQITGTDKDTYCLISEIREYVRDDSGCFVSRSRLNHYGADYSIEYKIISVKSNSLSDETFEVPSSVAEIRDEKSK